MAKFNEILAGRYNRALQKLLGLKGGPPSAQLASEIMPIIQFPMGRETRVLESWFLYASSVQIAPVAGQFGKFRLRNPKTSGTIAVVEKLDILTTVSASATSNFIYYVDDGGVSALATFPFVQQIDTRAKKATSLSFSAETSAASAVGVNIILQDGIGATAQNLIQFLLTDDQQIVLNPGTYIQFQSGAQNVPATITLWWRERAMEESEVVA